MRASFQPKAREAPESFVPKELRPQTKKDDKQHLIADSKDVRLRFNDTPTTTSRTAGYSALNYRQSIFHQFSNTIRPNPAAVRWRGRDYSPSTPIPGSTPPRTPFELYGTIDGLINSEATEDVTISIRIMLLSPTHLQSIKVRTVLVRATLTFRDLAKQELFLNIKKDELEPECIVSILIGNKILSDFSQTIGNTLAIEEDIVVYILFMTLKEAQCIGIATKVLKPYFNSLSRHGDLTANLFVHFQRLIAVNDDKNEMKDAVWEEATRYLARVPATSQLETLIMTGATKTTSKYRLYHNGNRISLKNKENKLPRTLREELIKLEGCDPLIFDIVGDDEPQDLFASIPCTHNSWYDYAAFIQLVRLRLEIIIWAAAHTNTFARFIRFCDKDKSGQLDARELRIAILTFLRLLRDEDVEKTDDTTINVSIDWDDHEPTSCARYLLPIPENAVTGNIDVFRVLLVDALVHYIRITQLKFVRRSDDMDKTLPIADIWVERVEPFLTKVKETITHKLVIPSPDMGGSITLAPVLAFTRNYLKELLFLPVTVYKMAYRFSIKKWNQQRAIATGVLISVLVTLCTLITIMNVVLFRVHLSKIDPVDVTAFEPYFPFALLIYMFILDYISRMIPSLTQARKKFLSVENSHRQAAYDLVRYRARPAVIDPLPLDNPNETLQRDANPNLNQLSFSASKPAQLKPMSWLQSNRRHLFIGSAIVFLAIIHTYMPIIARAAFGQKVIAGQWYVQCIIISYLTTGFVLFALFAVMISRAYGCFRNLSIKCRHTLLSAQIDERYIEQNETITEFLNIKQPRNLDYFLAKVKRTASRGGTTRVRIHLFTVTFTVAIGMILAVIAIIQMLTTGVTDFRNDPLSLVMLIDLIIMSLFVIAVLLVVVDINHASTIDVIRLLRRVHLETVRDEALHIEDEEDNGDYKRALAEAENTLNYLESVIEYTAATFDGHRLQLFGVITVDRGLVVKTVTTLITVSLAKLFELLWKKLNDKPRECCAVSSIQCSPKIY